MATRPVKEFIPEVDLSKSYISSQYRGNTMPSSTTRPPKARLRQMPKDMLNERTSLREKLLQMSLFPNLYNKDTLM